MSYETDYLNPPRRRIEPLHSEPQVVVKQKAKKKLPIAGISVVLLVLVIVGVSAYNFYKVQTMPDTLNSEWRCMTERCIDYYDKDAFFGEFCEGDECTFTFQNKLQSFTKGSLQTLDESHTAFCKSFVCEFEIIGRIPK